VGLYFVASQTLYEKKSEASHQTALENLLQLHLTLIAAGFALNPFLIGLSPSPGRGWRRRLDARFVSCRGAAPILMVRVTILQNG
jgi:hypothetical protein